MILMYSFGFAKLGVVHGSGGFRCGLYNGGLEQPIANWAKLGGTQWRPSEEGSPGRSKVIAHRTDLIATSTYRPIDF